MTDVRINGADVVGAGDESTFVVGYFGDANADRAYSSADVTLLQRVIVGRDAGFDAWAGVDPLLVADINASGRLTSLDAAWLLQEANFAAGRSNSDRPEIPPIPNLDRLRVTSFMPTVSGFHVGFSGVLSVDDLNLYGIQDGAAGSADVVLTGTKTGSVVGSLVLDADAAGFTFVRTGGALNPDTYGLVIDSGASAIHGEQGNLDGNRDGVTGDDYFVTFTVPPSARATVSIGEFARGPGQSVDLGAVADGLPIMLTNTTGANTVAFTLAYDPALLEIRGPKPGGGLSGASVTQTRIDASHIRFSVSSPSPIAAGTLELIRLDASVPATAPYYAKGLLDIQKVVIDGVQRGRGDDGVHVAAYFGDASGDAGYTTADVRNIVRTVVGRDSGFAAYPNVDPRIVADISGNRVLTSLDASRQLQEIEFLMGRTSTDRPEVPPIPSGGAQVVFAGPDPLVTLGGTQSGVQGEVMTVPVTIDTAEGLDSVQLRIAYDHTALTVVDVRKGNVTADFGWYLDRQTPGLIVVDMSRLDPLIAGSGSLLEIDLRIARSASGTLPIDLQSVRLNEGRLTLGVVPVNGADATDGAIVVVPPASQPSTPERGGLRGLLSRLASSLGGVFARSSAGSGTTVYAAQTQAGSADWKRSFVQDRSGTGVQPNSTLKITLPVEGTAKSSSVAEM